MTKRESILQALKSKLVSVTGVPNADVYRSRVVPFTRARVPAIVIEPVQDTPDINATPGLIDWALTFRVDVIVRGDVPDQVADPIVESVHSKIMSDTGLAGLSMDILPGQTSYELIESDKPTGIISMIFVVKYRTDTQSIGV